MNNFVGIGKIVETSVNGRVLKFTFAIKQEKPCYVPCLLFDPDDKVKEFVNQLQTSEQTISLQGRISSYDFEYQGRTIRKIEIVTYAGSIKTI